MNAATWHELVPARTDGDRRIREDCAVAGHLPLTHNAALAATFCRCGAARHPGNQRPMHAVHCYDHGCRDSCRAARAEHRAIEAPTPGAEAAPLTFRRLVVPAATPDSAAHVHIPEDTDEHRTLCRVERCPAVLVWIGPERDAYEEVTASFPCEVCGSPVKAGECTYHRCRTTYEESEAS